ncbi:MAG: MATE family efflux transporter [Phycisphaerales bacterium]|nr:MATE family efflux transporter [Phycisphaerales bacterium]
MATIDGSPQPTCSALLMSTSTPNPTDQAVAGRGKPPAPAWSLGAFREVWAIAFPTVLTMTSYTVMQFVDKLMVGQVGPVEVAAQGNGGVWSFGVIAFAMGAATVINTYVAQNLGAGTPERGPRYAWAGVWMSLVFWVLALVPYALVLPLLFARMGHAPELQALESIYAQIMLLGALPLLFNKVFSHFFFGLHRPLVITCAAVVGNLVNVALNYALIFGAEGIPTLGLPGVPGAPALGVAGAAIATVVGTAVELLIPLCVFLGPRLDRTLGTRAAWRPRWEPVRQILAIGWPGSVQLGNEIICWAIFMSVLVGTFGSDHMTAGWATLSYMHLSFMPAVGFSVAVSALVGRHIGAGQPEVAIARARLGLAMGVAYCSLCGLLFVVFRHQLIAAFVGGSDLEPGQAARIVTIGGQLLVCAAIFQAFDALGIVYMGALRGAGDTVWPGIVTVVLSWVMIVGGGWLLVRLAPGLQSLGPWIAAAAYIIVLGVAMAVRFERGRWRSIRLLEEAAEGSPGQGPDFPIGPMAHGGGMGEVEDIAADRAMIEAGVGTGADAGSVERSRHPG